MKIFARIIIFFGVMAAVFSSCEREYYTPVVISQTDSVFFSKDIMPVMVTNCAKSGCHDAATNAKGLNFESNVAYNTIIDYSLADTVNPDQSLIYSKINNGSMKAYSNSEFNAKLLLWLKQGAQNN